MNVSDYKAEIAALEMELAKTIDRLKTLYGAEYQRTELYIIRIKANLCKATALLEIAKYRAVA